jgi:hypothetical protein
MIGKQAIQNASMQAEIERLTEENAALKAAAEKTKAETDEK